MARASDPILARSAALAVVKRLREQGHTAYFAGGCVRDELLGLKPTDYDVATDATPDRIRALFARTAEVGASFGVVLVKPGPELGIANPRDGAGHASATIEVATFRSDGPYSDRRRPDSVTFSDPKSDALRRDFTINALFLDPDPAPGQASVIDYVNGQADLRAKVLRAVGDPAARLAEDHLRALRAARFAARFGFEIEPVTAEAIRAHASELRGVSRERVGEELRRIFAHSSFARAAELLQSLRLDAPALDEPHRDGPCPLLRALPATPKPPPFPTALAAWLIDRGLDPADDPRPIVARLRSALCLSNEEGDALLGCLESLALLLGGWLTGGVAFQKRAAATYQAGEFHEARRLMHTLDPSRARAIDARLKELEATPSKIRPESLISGDDLIASGLKPGKAFKNILDRVYDAQLEDRISTREQGLALAMELSRSIGI